MIFIMVVLPWLNQRCDRDVYPIHPVSVAAQLSCKEAQTVAQLTITEVDQGKTLIVHSGSVIALKLTENSGAGYQWEIESLDSQLLELQSSTFSLPSNAEVGGGGERIMTFKMKATGTTQLQLKEWRPWEGDLSIVQRFNVVLQIEN
jgi:inhibitor of cysteine peptidase